MVLLWLLSVSFLQQDTVPFKANDEFELTTHYEFKQRSVGDQKAVVYRDTEPAVPRNTGPLPYLSLSLKVLKTNPEEEKIRIINNENTVILNRKLQPGMTVNFEAGFTDDMKDRVKAHQFTILFLSKSKNPISKVVVEVTQDGTFLVNNEKRGKL